jgi:signal transduction histidine kinase
MDRRRVSPAILVPAGVIVFGCLAALVVVPLMTGTRAEELRTLNEKQVDPARSLVNQLNFELSLQAAGLAQYEVTGDREHLRDYYAAVARQTTAMDALAASNEGLGPAYAKRFRDLQRESDSWHAAAARYLQLKNTKEAHTVSTIAYEAKYPAVIKAASDLDAEIAAVYTARRAEIRRFMRVQMITSGGLVLFGFFAAVTVLWAVSRLRAAAFALAQESDERLNALRSRDEILGVVSHDLRNPLTTIALSTQLIPGSSREEQAEHVRTVLSTTVLMQRLIQDLLDATKMENSSLSMRSDLVDPETVAREAIAAHTPIAREKNIMLEDTIETPLPEITGDRDRLTQAVSNLLGNALKFTPSGGRVTFAVQASNGHVRFTVSDTGPGIAPTDLPHIFEPFWQAKKTAHLGAGLGLKITRAIVEAHGGSIVVSNTPAGGACFVFDLPTPSEA